MGGMVNFVFRLFDPVLKVKQEDEVFKKWIF